MKEYRVEGIAAGRQFEGDPTDAVLDFLEDAGAIDAVSSASASLSRVSAMFTLDANDIDSATTRGAKMLRQAFAAVAVELSGLSITEQSAAGVIDLLDVEVSGTEIARASGISRERVRQLASHSDFPEPVRYLGRSALWRWDEVADYFACRGRDPATLSARMAELLGHPIPEPGRLHSDQA